MKLNTRLILETLDEGQVRALRSYEELLRRRAVPLGLVSKRDLGRIWERHVVDSLRGARLEVPRGRVVDVGSGAGLPGIPMSIARPDRNLTLVERNQRSAGFLELAVEELGLENVDIVARPAESLGTMKANACLARAIAPGTAWKLATPLLGEDGFLLYWAGRTWELEGGGFSEAGVSCQILAPPEFPWQGPLVMMKASPSSTMERDDGS
ncbi:MAG: 16S rRNA (guanine(527)-N(7))-methyltransferase RsmG [Actinomycetota bacterium]